MKETITPGLVCPNCDYKMDRTSDMSGDAVPKSGDLTVCIDCGAWNVFEGAFPQFRLRPITAIEIARLPQELADKLDKFNRAIKQARATFNKDKR